MTVVRELLEELRARWGEQGAPIARNLLPGATEQQLDEAENSLGFPFSAELRDWYGWHNGFDRSVNELSLWPPFIWPGTLEEAIDSHALYRKTAQEMTEMADTGKRWEYGATWVSLTSPDPLILVADNDHAATDPQSPSAVYRVVMDGDPDDWRAVTVPSITSLVQGWLQLTHERILRFDTADGEWTVDQAAVPPELRICVI